MEMSVVACPIHSTLTFAEAYERRSFAQGLRAGFAKTRGATSAEQSEKEEDSDNTGKGEATRDEAR
jgi:hypothetical protein